MEIPPSHGRPICKSSKVAQCKTINEIYKTARAFWIIQIEASVIPVGYD